MRFLRGPSLAPQIVGLLVAGLIVAQIVTLFLTMVLPPAPRAQYSLADIAVVLRGGEEQGGAGPHLVRRIQAGPPNTTGAGWLTSDRSRRDLAELLGADDRNVVLSFYTPLPFAGTATAPVEIEQAGLGSEAQGEPATGEATPPGNAAGFVPASYLVYAASGPRGTGFPRAGFPGGGFPAEHGLPQQDRTSASRGKHRSSQWDRSEPRVSLPSAQQGNAPSTSAGTRALAPKATDPARGIAVPVLPAPVSRSGASGPESQTGTGPAPRTEFIPLYRRPNGLFGLAPAPFVEGDFVAALRLADGRWVVVQPVAAAFPNSWQRRVLLWFAIALAIVIPLGWMFARRIVRPLQRFARAAELLGRDPGAAILPLDGPAEVGRAANAFNLMQSRLRAFVDDRTAMISAISHDLRTPLTRLRFRIEEVADQNAREGMIEEVADMEAMIASVLEFLRDASTPGTRETIDLGSIVEEAVADALMIGRPVAIEQRAVAPVEVDVAGMRRVIDNLLENAVKYGDSARVRIGVENDDAIAEILDSGPGLPDSELKAVFSPFYRSPGARSSDKPGTGLGLAVCRSIARAHGGEIQLSNAPGGLCARVILPLAFDQKRLLAST